MRKPWEPAASMIAEAEAKVRELEKHDAPILQEAVGASLSHAEAILSEGASTAKSREDLADELYESERMRQWFETRIRAVLPADFDWEQVKQFAHWSAREISARIALGQLGGHF